MRKYQQALLLLVSIISVSILLMYKSENNRLKYVLEVVNFFGRADEEVFLKLDNKTTHISVDTNVAVPLPLWQRIGDDYYAYSGFWYKEMLTAGGKAEVLVVGIEKPERRLRCNLVYGANSIYRGKLIIERVAESDINKEWRFFKFTCSTNRDNGTPVQVQFSSINTGHTEDVFPVTLHDVNQKNKKLSYHMNLCLDLVSTVNEKNGSDVSIPHLVQLFLHYYLNGISQFIVYDTTLFAYEIKEILKNKNIKVDILPFNFPFALKSSNVIRKIMLTDCLMRSFKTMKYTVFAQPNEYLYVRNLNNSALGITEHNREDNIISFAVHTREICVDDGRRVLSDAQLMRVKNKSQFVFYKPNYYNSKISDTQSAANKELLFLHRYVNCRENNETINWRSEISKDLDVYINSVAHNTMALYQKLNV